MALDPTTQARLDAIARQYGIDPVLFRGIAQIESGGDPGAGRGGPYQGLFQLSPQEFSAGGGTNIFDPVQNAQAAATNLSRDQQQFRAAYGRAPSPTELYLIHQQGFGGLSAQLKNPTAPAWQNMLSTGEGQQKGAQWAKEAIWGNVPDDVKARFPGGVDSLTGQDFVNLWGGKVASFTGGQGGSATVPGITVPARPLPNALLAAAQAGGPNALAGGLAAPPQYSITPTAQTPLASLTPSSASGGTAVPNLLAAQVRPTPLLQTPLLQFPGRG